MTLDVLTFESEIEDCNQQWTFASDFADYIHARWLFGSIKNWDALCSEAFRVSKPGAWFESLEASTVVSSDDNTVDADSAMGHWGKFFIEGSKKIGSSVTVVEDGTQRKAMEAAGFINIQEFRFKVKVQVLASLYGELTSKLEPYWRLAEGPHLKGDGCIHQIWSRDGY